MGLVSISKSAGRLRDRAGEGEAVLTIIAGAGVQAASYLRAGLGDIVGRGQWPGRGVRDVVGRLAASRWPGVTFVVGQHDSTEDSTRSCCLTLGWRLHERHVIPPVSPEQRHMLR